MRLIDADEFRKRIDHYPPDIRDIAKKELRYVKTIDAEPVGHGRWMSSQGYAEVGECYCSKCATVYYTDDLYNVGETDENGVGQALMPNYCPHCGAQMGEVVEVKE